jgi:hypothetical protein
VKKVGISFMVLLLAICVIVTPVFAYEGAGTLGRPMNVYLGQGNVFQTTTTLVTDGDSDTYFPLKGGWYLNIGASGRGYPLKAVRLKSSGSMNISYFSQTLLHSENNSGNGEIVEFYSNLDSVTGIALMNLSKDTVNVHEFEFYYAAPIEPTNLIGSLVGETVNLSWTASINKGSVYNVYHNGVKINDKPISLTEYTIPNIKPGLNNTFYVTSLNPVDEESPHSNEVNIFVENPVADRALLTVHLAGGIEREYDLSLQEVNAFIDWYELKQAGSGKASYAINKHDNNKGPFKSRKDYILFDRILTFEVSEY